MVDLARSFRRHVDSAIAVVLVSTAISIYLGPVYVFILWFLSGCGYIIHTALKR